MAHCRPRSGRGRPMPTWKARLLVGGTNQAGPVAGGADLCPPHGGRTDHPRSAVGAGVVQDHSTDLGDGVDLSA